MSSVASRSPGLKDGTTSTVWSFVLALPIMASQRSDRRMRRVVGEHRVGGIYARHLALGCVADGQFTWLRKLHPLALNPLANRIALRALGKAGALERRLAN